MSGGRAQQEPLREPISPPRTCIQTFLTPYPPHSAPGFSNRKLGISLRVFFPPKLAAILFSRKGDEVSLAPIAGTRKPPFSGRKPHHVTSQWNYAPFIKLMQPPGHNSYLINNCIIYKWDKHPIKSQKLAEWINIHDPIIQCLQEKYCLFKDKNRLKKICPANSNQRELEWIH